MTRHRQLLTLALLLTGIFALSSPAELAAQDLFLRSCGLSDECSGGGAGGDGFVDPGEHVLLSLLVSNRVAGPATNISITATTSTPGVTITQGMATAPDIGAFGVGLAVPEIEYDVDPSVACGTLITIDISIVATEGMWLDACPATVPVACTPCSPPLALAIVACDHQDSCAGGAGDGNVDPGEAVAMTVTIRNDEAAAVTSVNAVVSSLTPGVTVTQGSTSFGTVNAGAQSSGAPPIEYSVANSVPCGTTITLDVALTSDQGPVQSACQVDIPMACTPCVTPPMLIVESCAPTDTCPTTGASDGNVDPGDDVALKVFIRNTGGTTATNVQVMASTATPGVTITQPLSTTADIGPGGLALAIPDLLYEVATSVACGTVVVIDLDITSSEGAWIGACQTTIPVACVPCLPPIPARVVSCVHADACSGMGAGSDTNVDPGESVAMTMTVMNDGNTALDGVVATVSSPTPGVTVTQSMAGFGTIAAMSSAIGAVTIDYVVADTVACGTTLMFDVLLTATQGSVRDGCSVDVPAACTPCVTPPFLVVERCTPTDTCPITGGSDGDVDPGDDVALKVFIRNAGGTTATNVQVMASTATPGVTITQPLATTADIGSGGLALAIPDLLYQVATSVACGTVVVIDLDITSSEGAWIGACQTTIPVNCVACLPPIRARVVDCVHADACSGAGAGGDGNVDPGESVAMTMTVMNDGNTALDGVVATVSSPTPGVTVTQSMAGFGTIPAMSSAIGAVTIDYRVDRTVACGTNLVFAVRLTAVQGAANDTCSVDVPAACTPCVTPPLLVVERCTSTDTCPTTGASDGSVDPGDDVSLKVFIRNAGGMPATNVQVMASTATPGVTITQPLATTADIAPSGLALAMPDLLYEVAPSVACGTVVVIDFDITSAEGNWIGACQATIPVTCVPCQQGIPARVVGCVHDDACAGAGGDGNVDPGEGVAMTLTVMNDGNTALDGVVATVSSPTPGVTVTQAISGFGTIPTMSSASGAVAIDYLVDETVACGTTLMFDVLLTAAQGAVVSDCSVSVPAACTPCMFRLPREVPHLDVRCNGATVELDWLAATDADWYAIHQGTLAALASGAALPWDHGCAVPGVFALTSSTATTTCGDLQDVYFLVVGVNPSGEGPYGFARINAVPVAVRGVGVPACP